MRYPEGTISVWFGNGRQSDGQYLQTWREAPLTYSSDQEIDFNWNVDRYEIILGKDNSGQLFQRAAELTLHNQFYPAEVMSTVSDFSRENRKVRPGDRVVQRISLLEYKGIPILDVLTMNEISEVIQEPRRAGFTYITTAAHSEIGEWSPLVEWRDNGEVVLVIDVISRIRPGVSSLARRFARRMQLRAHKLSIQNFLARLSREPYQVSEPFARPVKLLPAAMLAMAFILFITTFFGFSPNRKP